jgi:CDP-glycerol glycerophosphotransferase (TagB/SpsB family)
MLLNRPILYYVPDLDAYQKRRALYFKPEDMMPGVLLRRPEELYRVVETLDPSQPPDKRLPEIRSLVWGSYCGNAAADIQAFLEGSDSASL